MTNLSLQALKDYYQSGKNSPRDLILNLREQALSQSDFNAWITLLDESQLRCYFDYLDSHTPETLPLYGVPFAIKDNIDLAHTPTTAGCPDFTYTPEESAPVVQALIDAGAIPLGKTNLDQFATGLVGTRSPYGQAKNAFNQEYISGGSSAGSAIATALGQVTFSLGTDTAGSGRVPAALNNLIGLKPSKGLLSTRGVVPACRSLDCVSIFALNCDDANVLLNICALYDEQDLYSRQNYWRNAPRFYNNCAHKKVSLAAKNSIDRSESTFIFGVPSQLDFQGNKECEALYHKALKNLVELGGKAKEIDFSPFRDAAKLLYEGPWVAERVIATEQVPTGAMLDVIKTIIKEAPASSAENLFSAQYKLASLKKICDQLISDLDFVLTPTMPTQYTRAQIDEQPIKNNSILGTYTNFMNLLDYCATSIPVGVCGNGIPWGVTLFANALEDVHVLGYAAALHRSFKLHQGATRNSVKYTETSYCDTAKKSWIEVIVCGAHLDGQPLNWQLTERNATLVEKTHSSPCYQMWVLSDGKRPAMIRSEKNGVAIEIEIWQMPEENFGSFVNNIPAPLGIGKVEVEDGRWLSGFICDASELDFSEKSDLSNISHYGGWRQWKRQSC